MFFGLVKLFLAGIHIQMKFTSYFETANISDASPRFAFPEFDHVRPLPNLHPISNSLQPGILIFHNETHLLSPGWGAQSLSGEVRPGLKPICSPFERMGSNENWPTARIRFVSIGGKSPAEDNTDDGQSKDSGLDTRLRPILTSPYLDSDTSRRVMKFWDHKYTS